MPSLKLQTREAQVLLVPSKVPSISLAASQRRRGVGLVPPAGQQGSKRPSRPPRCWVCVVGSRRVVIPRGDDWGSPALSLVETARRR